MTKDAARLDLNWMQATGSALAALSSAVLMSTLGATGTLVGAALGSIVVTVGGTVYSHYLSVSRERVAAARSAALRHASRPRGRSGDGGVEAVTRTLAQAPERFPLLAASARGGVSPAAAPPAAPGRRLIDGNLPGTPTSLRQLLRGPRWKPALAASLGVFVVVMGLIVSMELATGRALSSYTGGSSTDGPGTSLTLLSSSVGDTDDSTTTDTADDGSDKTAGSTDDGGRQAADDTAGGSTAGSASESGSDAGAGTDAPESDGSSTEPDTSTATEPEPTPEAPATEPAPEPTPAPTTQAPAQAPAPAPTPDAAVDGAVTDTVS